MEPINDDQAEARRQEQEHHRRCALVNRQLQIQLLRWMQITRWPTLSMWKIWCGDDANYL